MSTSVADGRVLHLRDCIEAIGGAVFLPGEADYIGSSDIWNPAVEHRPAAIVRCRTVDEVRLAVRAARIRNFPLSVRGGGHDWAGRSLRHDGMVLDMSGMRQVTVDGNSRVATVAGGATAADVISAARPYGLVAVTGHVGLAVDNLLAADVVLQDGSLVTANRDNNADLFWALRGGGGNFGGVVTSMRIQLHAATMAHATASGREICPGR
jgi:FAD/FMN-containing dehydrogenase